MSELKKSLNLPDYQNYINTIENLHLPVTGNELHGILCGYICAGDTTKGDAYIRALISNQKDAEKKEAALLVYDIYAISEQQLANFDFEFQLMIPDIYAPLQSRAEAFSEWCRGFLDGLSMAGVDINSLVHEDAEEAYNHLLEFAKLDCDTLDISEDDERAFVDVSEYARIAVMHIFSDLRENIDEQKDVHH